MTQSAAFFHGEDSLKAAGFLANTGVKFRGEQIAVRQLEGEPDRDVPAAAVSC